MDSMDGIAFGVCVNVLSSKKIPLHWMACELAMCWPDHFATLAVLSQRTRRGRTAASCVGHVCQPFSTDIPKNGERIVAIRCEQVEAGTRGTATRFDLLALLEEAAERDTAVGLCPSQASLAAAIHADGELAMGMALETPDVERLRIPACVLTAGGIER